MSKNDLNLRALTEAGLPDWQPEVIDHLIDVELGGADPERRAAFAARRPSIAAPAVAALGALDATARRIAAGALAVDATAIIEPPRGRGNLGLTPRAVRYAPELVERFAKASALAYNAAWERSETRLGELRSLASALDAEMTNALRAPSKEHAAEIRAYIRGRKPAERIAFVHDAIAHRDVTTLGALFGAPPYLAGIAPEDVATLRERAVATLAPDAHVARRVAAKVTDRVVAARRSFEQLCGRIAARYQDRRGAAAGAAIASITEALGGAS